MTRCDCGGRVNAEMDRHEVGDEGCVAVMMDDGHVSGGVDVEQTGRVQAPMYEMLKRRRAELVYEDETTGLEIRVEVLHPETGIGVLMAVARDAVTEAYGSHQRRMSGEMGGVAVAEG